ncbi:response regulator [Chloroflexia bacterium SDU3-3]|nr:response regulator [Chloroflexia bacterium SDU3-3]
MTTTPQFSGLQLPTPHVLVVDDDTGVRDVCVRALRLHGYRVGSAENGRVALQKLCDDSYDLVLTDLQMPEMGGIRLLQELRKISTDTDVIVFTAYGTFESAREALRLGAVDYLTKPLELEDLDRTVRRTLEWRKIRQEKQRLSEIVALYEISQTFTTTLDTTTAVREIVNLLWRRFLPHSLSLSLYHPDDHALELLAQRGCATAATPGTTVALYSCDPAQLTQAHNYLAGGEEIPGPGYEESVVLQTRTGPVGLLRLTRNGDQPLFGSAERTMLAVVASQIAAALENSRLYQQLKEQHIQTIAALAASIEARDPHTSGHSEQVMRYAVRLAEYSGMAHEKIERLRYGALLHDIGKIGIRDYVLLKPGPLTSEEQTIMQQHPVIGAEILRQIRALGDVIPIIEDHHERIDGHGYPYGKRGEELSEEARILAIADAYDAMTSNRAYRKAMPPQEALTRLLRGRGTSWDTRLVDLFVAMIEQEGDTLLLEDRAPQLVVDGPLGRPMLARENGA